MLWTKVAPTAQDSARNGRRGGRETSLFLRARRPVSHPSRCGMVKAALVVTEGVKSSFRGTEGIVSREATGTMDLIITRSCKTKPCSACESCYDRGKYSVLFSSTECTLQSLLKAAMLRRTPLLPMNNADSRCLIPRVPKYKRNPSVFDAPTSPFFCGMEHPPSYRCMTHVESSFLKKRQKTCCLHRDTALEFISKRQ